MMSIFVEPSCILIKDRSGYIELDELQEALADESGETDADVINEIMREVNTDKDGQISIEEFVAMMKTGTDWRKASRQYSRERFKSLSLNLMKDGSLQLQDGFTVSASAGGAAAAAAPTAAEAKKEVTAEEKEESDDDMGFSFFD